ncbi:IclR family transcriptional regulator domain-containing protein [Janibacter melonis]|uniref:IclR family transcriptional regulator domain-containing protein n=1 Tax=Janibacter melonis TaxID=262209 RepID=UPI00209509E9|nr:IclR family transcriptional regulator C-terminal domain-containing protein [Janibacter melonis]
MGLGVAAFELASGYQRQSPLQRLARPVLQRLADETTHNGHLAVLHGRDVLYVAEERAPGRPPRLRRRRPAAGDDDRERAGDARGPARPPGHGPLPRRRLGRRERRVTGHPSALRRELVAVRRRGHALESGSVTQGLASVALAVLDRTGQPLAAVALTYPEGTVTGPEELLVPFAARSRRSTAGSGPLPPDEEVAG